MIPTPEQANSIRNRIQELRRAPGGHRIYLALEPSPEGWTVIPRIGPENPYRDRPDPDTDPLAGEGLTTDFWRPTSADLLCRELWTAHPGIRAYFKWRGQWLRATR